MSTVNLPETPSTDSLGYGSEENLHVSDKSRPIEDQAIYVNKRVNFQKLEAYGFDMDYTLCEYISPNFDKMAFDQAKDFLLQHLQYPKEVNELEYDSSFPKRGLWHDSKHGNLIKVDQFGEILLCCHGFRYISGDELRTMYPHKIQRKSDPSIYVMNTLFNLPETHLIASLTHFMDNRPQYSQVETGWRSPSGSIVTYADLFQDVRAAIEHLHEEKTMKIEAVTHPEKYIKRDSRLNLLINRIRESGRKCFLLTNSDWWYTNHIMAFLLDENKDEWVSYFDLTVVDASKPKFFNKKNPLKRVDTLTSQVIPTEAPPPPGPVVYSGGDQHALMQLLGLQHGSQVLYCGDHLYADVIKSKKESHWRTLLIVPELLQEVSVYDKKFVCLGELNSLEKAIADARLQNESKELREKLWDCIKALDRSFGHTGSLFRSGNRLTYFASHLLTFTDLYTGSVLNLLNYGLDERFLPLPTALPHERERLNYQLADSPDLSKDEQDMKKAVFSFAEM